MTTPNGTKIGESFGKTKGATTTGTDKSNLNIRSQEFRIAFNPKILTVFACVVSIVKQPKRKCSFRWNTSPMISQSIVENKPLLALIGMMQPQTPTLCHVFRFWFGFRPRAEFFYLNIRSAIAMSLQLKQHSMVKLSSKMLLAGIVSTDPMLDSY